MPTAIPKSFIADTALPPAAPAGAPKSFVADAPATAAPYRYQIPDAKAPPPETSAQKITRYTAEAAAAKKESDYANSPLGFAANFGKALVKNVAPSEVGLGGTIAKVISGPPNVEGFNQLSGYQTQLIKMIREGDAAGKDTTKLKRIFNSNADLLDEHKKRIEDYNASLPSTGQAVGQLAGTALDLLSAGTYGKAAAGLKTGVLGKASLAARAPGVVGKTLEAVDKTGVTGTAAGQILTPAKEATGLFSKAGAGRVLKGGALGYAYDVTQGLQGGRGKDRTGGNAFIPGTGTAIGAAIPAALELDKSIHNAADTVRTKFSQDAYLKDREQNVQDIIDSGVKTKKLDAKITSKGNSAAATIASDDKFIPEINKGVISSERAVNNIQEQASPMAKVVRAVVESDNKSVPIKDLENQALKEIDDLKLRGDEYNRVRNNILSDFASYRENYGVGEGKDFIPLTVVDDIKKAKYENINWNNPDLLSADRAIARAGRKTIERSITDIDVRALNQELGRLYDAQDMLTALNGRSVGKFGKLGSHFLRLTGTIIGGSHGPVGSVVGAVTADRLADFMSSSSFDNPIFKKAIGDIQRENPAIFAQAQEVLAKRAADASSRLALPAASNVGPVINQGRPIKVFPAGLPATAQGDYLGKDTAIFPAARNPLPMIGTVEKAVAGSPTAIADTVGRHIAESQQVLDNLDAATIAKEGGLPALLEHTKTNIVDGLKAEGAQAVADAIAQISTASFKTLAEFAAAVQQVLPK